MDSAQDFTCDTVPVDAPIVDELIMWLSNEVKLGRIGKRAVNYTLKSLKLDQQIGITYIRNSNGEFVAFASIQHAVFYPSSIAKILNRYMISENYRYLAQGRKNILNVCSRLILLSQLEYIKRHPEIHYVFVCQETPHERRMKIHCQMASVVLQETHQQKFVFADQPVLVLQTKTSKSSFQHLYYAQIGKYDLNAINFFSTYS